MTEKLNSPDSTSKGRSLSTITVCLLLTTAFTIPFLVIVFFPFNIPNKIAFAMLIGVLTCFVVFSLVTTFLLELKITRIVAFDFIFIVIYYVFLLVVGFQILYNNLYGIYILEPFPIINFFLVTSISAFIPGYAILKLVKRRLSLPMSQTLLYSVLLSILFSSFIGFIAWLLGGVAIYTGIIFVILNLCILISISAKYLLRDVQYNEIHPTSFLIKIIPE